MACGRKRQPEWPEHSNGDTGVAVQPRGAGSGPRGRVGILAPRQ